MSAWRKLVQGLAACAVLGAGWAASQYLMQTAPKARRQPPERRARLVEVTVAAVGDHQVEIAALGTVLPARRQALQPRVGGYLSRVDPRWAPGGVFRSGEVMLELERADLDLTLRERQAAVVQAQAELRLEEGRQAIAKREFELLGRDLPGEGQRDLVLRQPQLALAQARLDSALAAAERARLELERAQVKAPFDALVLSRQVDVGAQVLPTTALGELAATDVFWVEAALPVEQLPWLDLEIEGGAGARIFYEAGWGPGRLRPSASEGARSAPIGAAAGSPSRGKAAEAHFRAGRVLRLAGSLEEQGRMARVIIACEDPLDLGSPAAARAPLLIGAYVRVTIAGRTLKSVVALDRRQLRGDRLVWLLENDRLVIRELEIACRGPEQVYVSAGLAAGDRIITTDLSAAVEGMALRLGVPGQAN